MKTITGIRKQKGYDTSIEAPWKKGDIIRNIQSGHPYLVVHIYIHSCTVVIDMEDRSELKQTYTIVPAQYNSYTSDRNMELVKKNEKMSWQYNPFTSL